MASVTALRSLARGYKVRWALHLAQEVDETGLPRTIGYDLELTGAPRPLLWVWYGDAAAREMVGAALRRVAAHVLSGPCGATVCPPDSLPLSRELARIAPVRLRLALYCHQHALEDVDPQEQPCVRALRAAFAAIGVPLAQWFCVSLAPDRMEDGT